MAPPIQPISREEADRYINRIVVLVTGSILLLAAIAMAVI
jgi:hypothetical protein